MNVSFDGLRSNATRSMNRLYAEIKDITEKYKDDFYHGEDDDLMKAFNEAAMYVDTFNCLEDDAVKDDMNCMDDLSVNRFDED